MPQPTRRSNAHRADPKFKHKLNGDPNIESLKFCYQCGRCTAACPISKFIDIYRPNKIIKLAKLGIRDMPQSNAFLFCSACSLCSRSCPQRVKVHEIMEALKGVAADDENVSDFLAEGFDDVLESLGKGMPFPVVYSWICLRPSEHQDDMGAAILKAFDRALLRPWPQKNDGAASEFASKRAAIIGAGPAGLTAAWELARAGLAVTVYENLSEPGGMLRAGIPNYRLPKSIVDAEIDRIKAAGVEICANTNVDRDFFDNLVENFSAVFIATGAFASRRLRLEGENLKGVVTALEFLREYNMTGKARVGKNVVVIGGGNVAVDAAGAAMRCGAESVKLFCLEDRANMPAHEWEILEIANYGVGINASWGPKAILGNGEKVTGVEFIYCKSVLDGNKKFSPVFDEKKTQKVEADTVITAIGQSPDLSFLSDNVGAFRGVVQVDPYTMETSLPNVFAGGDAVAGTASLIEAIMTGKTAAESIMRYLDGLEDIL